MFLNTQQRLCQMADILKKQTNAPITSKINEFLKDKNYSVVSVHLGSTWFNFACYLTT